MSTIASLIEQIERDRKAVESTPAFQAMKAAIEDAAKTQRESLVTFRVAENLTNLRAELLREAEANKNFMNIREQIVKLATAQVARPDYPHIPERNYYFAPPVATAPVEEELPRRTIVRKEVKRKIGFTE